MTFHVVINTYKRPEMLDRLTKQICLEASKSNVDVILDVFFDGCDPYPISSGDRVVSRARNMVSHRGKKKYYELVKMNFEVMRDTEADYHIKLDDDLVLKNDFFKHCAEYWQSIRDDSKMTLMLLRDHREKMWGSDKPVMMNKDVIRTDWCDLIFMCDDKLPELVCSRDDFFMPPPDWLTTSSGVGRQLTRNIRGFKYDDDTMTTYTISQRCGNMYQVATSLVNHGNHQSMMNPERNITHINALKER